ncbi:hypothetical protein BKA80DRAFT_133564 [Phyllosticta citrichinensis]
MADLFYRRTEHLFRVSIFIATTTMAGCTPVPGLDPPQELPRLQRAKAEVLDFFHAGFGWRQRISGSECFTLPMNQSAP